MTDDPHPFLRRLADKHGVDINDIPRAPERTGCPVCDRDVELDEAVFAFVPMMCDDHAEQVRRRIAEQVLRPVIPAALHAARPGDVPADLRAWNPSLGGVYLFGPVGTGKSHTAAALVKVAWRHFVTASHIPRVAWRNVPTMMDDIAATFGSKDMVYDMGPIRDAELLVLDDIGLGDSMPFAVRKLYALLEHRLNAGLPTIVTSNRSLDELANHLGSPQIASRLAAMCAQVDFDGLPDRRPGLAPSLRPPERS